MTQDLQDWLDLDAAARRDLHAGVLTRAREESVSHHAWISVVDATDEVATGEFAEIPFAVKDNIDVAGMETTAGGPLFRGHVAEVDSDVVSVLREAGAVVIGKANLHELAFGGTSNNATYGPVRNPFDPSRVAGGSSGGSAVAVALGSVPFSLGTDTGGSVTVPSAFCGVVGFRPTTGRYPGTGVVNLSTSRDTIGLHARTVADVRTVDRVIVRSVAGAHAPDLAGLTLGRVASRFAGAETAVIDVVDAALDRLRERGVTVIDVEIPDDIELASGAGLDLVFFETPRLVAARHARGVEAPAPFDQLIGSLASPDVRQVGEGIVAAHLSVQAYELARRRRWELRRAYDVALASSGVDALVGPTAMVLPPPIGDDDLIDVDGCKLPTFGSIIRNAGPGSVAGVPMLSVPAGFSGSGLPVGLCLEGRFFGDDALLAVGESIAAALATPSTSAPSSRATPGSSQFVANGRV